MGDEFWETESKMIRFFGRPLEVCPRRIREEALDDVARVLPEIGLVEEGEADGVFEGPLQDAVVIPGQDLDVDGHVAVLPAAVAVQEEGSLDLVPVLRRVKWRRDELEAVGGLGLGHPGLQVLDLPDQDAVVRGQAGFFEVARQLLYVSLLFVSQGAHEVEVVLFGILHMCVHVFAGSPESASGLLVNAVLGVGQRAIDFQMSLDVLALEAVSIYRSAKEGTRNRK